MKVSRSTDLKANNMESSKSIRLHSIFNTTSKPCQTLLLVVCIHQDKVVLKDIFKIFMRETLTIGIWNGMELHKHAIYSVPQMTGHVT